MGVDLKHARGIELLMALWKISHIWMEASAPGTLERNGITNELALAINPSLIILRISTYGQYGEPDYLGRPGYDALAQAFGGMMNVTGDPAGPPQRAKVYTGDYITALTGWAATMMALLEVKKSGRGQVIDLAQYEAIAQTQGHCMPLYTGQGVPYGHAGNRAPGFQPYDTFKCSDGWVFVGALGDPMVSRLAAFLGLDTAVYNFGSVSSDVAAVNSPEGKEFDRRLREYCAGKTTAGSGERVERRTYRLCQGAQSCRPVCGPTVQRPGNDRASARSAIRRARSRLWRSTEDVAYTRVHLAWRRLDWRGHDRHSLQPAWPVPD